MHQNFVYLPPNPLIKKRLDKLITLYDGAIDKDYSLSNQKRFPPTEDSVKIINKKFGITLPDLIIYFSQNSRYFYSGLGKDFDNHYHILRLNQHCRKMRRRALKGQGDYPGQWAYCLPTHFIVLWGSMMDDDYTCLDTSKFDTSTGEYELTYWSPPRYDKRYPRYSSFIDFIEQTVDFIIR